MRFVTILTLAAVAAGACLASYGQQVPPAGVKEAQPVSKSPDRVAALAKMAMDKNPADKAALKEALADPEPLVRRHAVYGLERLGDPASAKDLVPLLKDPDTFARRGAAIALGKLKNPDAVAPLTEALAADDLRLRVEAFTALGRIAEPSTQKAILKAMEDGRLWRELGTWEIHTVINVITRDFFTDRGAVTVLRKLLAFKDMDNLNLAGETPERRASAALLVSNFAAEILATKFGDASGEESLIAGVESADDYMQQTSSDVVGLLKSRKAVPGLVKLLTNEWVVNRRKAAAALGAIGDASAVPELEKLLKAPPPAPPAPQPAAQARPTTATAPTVARGDRPPRTRPPGEPDARLRALAADMLQKIDGKKREVDLNDPPAVIPSIAEAELKTPGGKRPPQFICLGVDDCVNIEGLEAMLDICETLRDKGAKAVFTMWVAPLASDYKNRDIEKEKLLLQRLFDMGCEVANHTLMHNPGGVFWTAREKDFQVQMIDGAAQWYRDNLVGFTRPFAYKGGGGASGTAIDRAFSDALLARQRFLYGGGRGSHPNQQNWALGVQPYYRLDTGCLDAAAPPVHAAITDPIHSDYSGRFDYEVPAGLAMWKANFEFHYNHPRRPILAVNAFHDWGLKRSDGEGTKTSHRNQSAILKAFLLDALVANKDKYPQTHCVTFRQVTEYIATDGDLKHALAVGNCQDSRNPLKPKLD